MPAGDPGNFRMEDFLGLEEPKDAWPVKECTGKLCEEEIDRRESLDGRDAGFRSPFAVRHGRHGVQIVGHGDDRQQQKREDERGNATG